MPCYTNSGDAPRKISILVVVSLWFGRLLQTLRLLRQVWRFPDPKKIFHRNKNGVAKNPMKCANRMLFATPILEHPLSRCPVLMIIPGILASPGQPSAARQKALARRSARPGSARSSVLLFSVARRGPPVVHPGARGRRCWPLVIGRSRSPRRRRRGGSRRPARRFVGRSGRGPRSRSRRGAGT